MYKLFSLFLLASSLDLSAEGRVTCDLRFAQDPVEADASAQLTFNDAIGSTEAIFVSNWGTKVFECHDSIIDEYECYGFGPEPAKTPIQLNVVGDGLKHGSTVIYSAVNLFFLDLFSASNFSRDDTVTRRISIDTYVVQKCS